MSFKIIINENISLSDLLVIYKNGGVVLKTPHVGNIYPNNLAIASIGLPMLLYDRTLGIRDTSFHPHKIIVSGKSEIIADPNILSTHSKITCVPESHSTCMRVGDSVSNFHSSALRSVFPDLECITYTEYLIKNRQKIVETLKKVTDLYPALWYRSVNKEGYLSSIAVKSWDDVLRIGIYGVTNDCEGLLIPNIVSIFFHGSIDATSSGVNNIYLLSGPDMYKYISTYQDKLASIFEFIKENAGYELPDYINCHIVPVLNVRFTVDYCNREKIDKLMHLYFDYIKLESVLKNNNGLNSDLTQSIITDKLSIKKEIEYCILQSLSILEKTMFYDPSKASCFTQHDMLMQNTILYTHPWALGASIKEVSRCYEFLYKRYLNAIILK
jgi:hypothetical protein